MFGRLIRAMFRAPSLIPSVFVGRYDRRPLEAIHQEVVDGQAMIVDVREAGEWRRGHVAGAASLPLSELAPGIADPDYVEQITKTLPKDRVLYTHCMAGGRSLIAAEALGRLGYEVRALKQGYRSLLKAGFSAEAGSSPDAEQPEPVAEPSCSEESEGAGSQD